MSARSLFTAALSGALLTGSLLGTGAANATSGDPYSSDGTWLVPSEISPGTYRAVPNDGTSGYWAVCGDYVCDPFGGMIDNDFFNGSSVVVVPSNAVAVELNGVSLTRMG